MEARATTQPTPAAALPPGARAQRRLMAPITASAPRTAPALMPSAQARGLQPTTPPRELPLGVALAMPRLPLHQQHARTTPQLQAYRRPHHLPQAATMTKRTLRMWGHRHQGRACKMRQLPLRASQTTRTENHSNIIGWECSMPLLPPQVRQRHMRVVASTPQRPRLGARGIWTMMRTMIDIGLRREHLGRFVDLGSGQGAAQAWRKLTLYDQNIQAG